MVTYDGKVSMCCYDWGSMHNIGYVDELAIKIKDKEYKNVIKKVNNKHKSFRKMNPVMPKKFNTPEEKVLTLRDIWFGEEIEKIRRAHIHNKVNEIEVCKKCPFKETYLWKAV